MATVTKRVPCDPKDINAYDLAGRPLILDGIGCCGELHVVGQMLVEGYDEDEAYETGYLFFRRLDEYNKRLLDDEAKLRFDAHVLSKE